MRRAVVIVCAVLLVCPVVLKSRRGRNIPPPAAFPVMSSSRVLVKVSGNVHYPGIYSMPANSVADTAINLAVPLGPPRQYATTSSASRSVLNGTALQLDTLPDGGLVVTVNQMTVSERLVLGIPLDISTMSEADFERLPGIGPALAKRIITFRQNNGGMLRVEDLAGIEGIGVKTFQKLQAYF